MRVTRSSWWLAALAGAWLGGCGESSGGNARMSVHLVDAPADYQTINLDIQRVEIHSDANGWVTLGTPNKTVDLLGLTSGVEETLVNGASLPAGSYGQMRLVLGPGNSVVLKDGSTHALKVPSGTESGVKLNVNFQVQPNTTKDVFIDFDARHSIFLHGAGASGQYLLRPVVTAVDRIVTGAVTGTLTDALTHTPLPGVLVTAQTIDGAGAPHVARAVETGADGRYALDLLPVDASYHVVSQPVVGTTAYDAKASGPIPITAAAPTPTYDAAFTVTTQVGNVNGTITPIASDVQADTVDAERTLDAGGTPARLIVASTTATAATTETYAFTGLPAAAYDLVLTRRTVDASGNETIAVAAPAPVTVAAGATATVNLAAP